MLFLLLLLAAAGLAFHVMSPDERRRTIRVALTAVYRAKDATTADDDPALDAFHDALRARTTLALVTPAIILLNIVIFVGMLFGAGAFADPATLVAWGGNFGPRTTNGEWGRLVTTMFVHAGILHLLVNIVAIVQIGAIVERLVGPFAFAAVYLAAGIFSSLVNLVARPLEVSVGATSAVFGIYGLLAAVGILGIVYRSTVTIPLRALKHLAPVAAVFILYNALAAGGIAHAADFAGFITGIAGGFALTTGVGERTAPAPRVAIAVVVTLLMAVASAVPLRGLADVRPEIARLIAIEDRTASAYESAVGKFRTGRINVETLVNVIDRAILPELQAARARLKTFGKVATEHQPLLAGAQEYLQLRDQSWRLRSDALHKRSLAAIRAADTAERASLEALQRIRPVDQE